MGQDTSRPVSNWNFIIYVVGFKAMLYYKHMETHNKGLKCFVCDVLTICL